MLRLQYLYHLHAPFHRSIIFAMRPRYIVSVLSLHQLLHPGSGTSSLHAAMTNNDRDVAKRGVANLFSLLGSERLSFAFSFLSLFGRLPLCRRATTCEQHGGVILRFFSYLAEFCGWKPFACSTFKDMVPSVSGLRDNFFGLYSSCR